MKAAKENEHGVIFAFALATGMRPEEYLGLKWSDVDLKKGTAVVRRVLIRRKGGGWYFGEPKTSRSRRTIPFPKTLVEMLTAHRRKQIAARLKVGAAYQNNDLVFATGEGTPHNSRNLAQRQFHASVVLTLDTYSHVLPTMQEAASQKLERILFG
ncbi:MAG: site-specific integrase [Acidobacteria bacterium]|nr:site-specific integrase [Acidobacteriota bacterium]